MSQHLMTVTSLSGATVKLVAGFDPRLREFFLSLRDARIAAPDETPEELDAQAQAALDAQQAGYVNYDSLSEAQPIRHISYVEGLLQENEIPFEDAQVNPALGELLVVIMNEQRSGGPEVGRTLRNWDAEAEEADFERGCVRDEQHAEWAAEARANREAEEAEKNSASEGPCFLPFAGLGVTKAQVEAWWARHPFPIGRNNCGFRFPAHQQRPLDSGRE